MRFYSNYHSQRYVEGKLVIRMRQGPTEAQLAALNDEFGDIVVSGDIECDHDRPRSRDDDHPELDRIMFHFNRRDIGKLRQMVNRVNGWAAES